MLSLTKFAAAAATTLLLAATTASADPGACSGECWAHDPALIKKGDVYYRFNTGGGMQILTSSDISGPWTLQGEVIPDGSVLGQDDLWAPDVHLVGSTYILYYSVSTFGSQESTIGYATSSSLDPGTWTDHGTTGVSSVTGDAYNAIDGNLIQSASDSSDYRMNFGSFWSDIYQVSVGSSATAASGTPVQLSFQPTGTHPREGSYMFYRSGYYYLFFSEGICCGYDSSMPATGEEYKIKVCRSTSIDGGFVDSSGTSCNEGGGDVVLESGGTTYGPGGQGVMTDDAVGTVLYYHYVDTTVGYADGDKKFGWNVLNWSGGWPSV